VCADVQARIHIGVFGVALIDLLNTGVVNA
jgi:hypothetical protein